LRGVVPIKSLGTFPEAAGESVVHEGSFEDIAEGILDGHARLGSVGGDFDLLGLRGGITF
jgi:hypothetical protein